MMSKKMIGLIGFAIASILLLTGLWIAALNNNDSVETTPSTTPTAPTVTKTVTATVSPKVAEPVVKHGVSGKSLEQDKKDVVAAAASLMNDAMKNPKALQPKDRLLALDKSDYSSIDKSFASDFRFIGETPDGLKNSAYESILTMALIATGNDPKVKVTPVGEDVYKTVYVDQQLGTAFVPVNAVSKQSNVFTIQFVYVDGRWLVEPYSLVNQVKISATVSQQSTLPTPTK